MKWKLWLNIFTLAALCVLIYVAWPDIVAVMERSQGLNVWVLALMVPLQFLFYLALAKFFFYFFHVLDTKKVGMRTLFPAMMELNFVNHIFPSGGLSGFSYLTLRLKSLDVSTAKSTLAQLGRFWFTFVVYIILMLVALFLLAIEDRASSLVVLLVSGIVFTLLFSAGIITFIIGREHRILWFTQSVVRVLNRLIHIVRRHSPETIKPDRVKKTFLELHEDYVLMRLHITKTKRAFVWITIATVVEAALLYVVFVAHGVWVNPGAVVIALVVANSAGLIAALPGGLGVYEPLMTAIFIAVGMTPGLAISVTLVFRIITLLLSLLTGYVLYQRAIHTFTHGTTNLQRQRTH